MNNPKGKPLTKEHSVYKYALNGISKLRGAVKAATVCLSVLTLPPTGQPYWTNIGTFHNSCRVKFTARCLTKWCKDLLLSQNFE